MAELKPDFELTVTVNRQGEKITLGLRDLDEQVYLAAQKMFAADKTHEGVKILIANLTIAEKNKGDKDKVLNSFIAIRSAIAPLAELMQPLEGELKKN